METDTVPWLHCQLIIRDSIALQMTLQLEVAKIKAIMFRKYQFMVSSFPVCGELFVFREGGMLLPAKLCKYFLPAQNVFFLELISCAY